MSRQEDADWYKALHTMSPLDRSDLSTVEGLVVAEIEVERREREVRKARILRRCRIFSLSTAGIALAGSLGYALYTVHEQNQARDRQDKVEAVAQVLNTPSSLRALGLCPAELEQEAQQNPTRATEYSQAAASLAIAAPHCDSEATGVGLVITVSNGDHVMLLDADVVPGVR